MCTTLYILGYFIEFSIVIKSANMIMNNNYVHSVIGFWQLSPPLHLQYLIPATMQQHPFLQAHLPHVQGSGRPSGLEITISGTYQYKRNRKPQHPWPKRHL